MAVRPLGGPFYSPDCPKWPFLGSKISFLAGNSFVRDIIQKNYSHCDGTPKRQHFCVDSLHGGPLGARQGPFLAQNLPQKLSFFTLHPYSPPFLGSDGPDSIASYLPHILLGNSGYPWFSGRWPLGRSACCFMAAIAQSGLFWGQKCCFLAGNSFSRDIIQKNCCHCDGTSKRQQFCVFGPKLTPKTVFFALHPVAPIFGTQTD